ncbi:hypothetical protein [Deinococcus sp.]|nr:hypothetical protein [Deinococcus sp.]
MYYADLDTLTKARLADAGASRLTEPTPGWMSRWVKWVLERLEHRK